MPKDLPPDPKLPKETKPPPEPTSKKPPKRDYPMRTPKK